MINSKKLLERVLKPRARSEDLARREYILNILLVGCIVLAFVATIVGIVTFFRINQKYPSAPPLFVFSFFIFFCFLYVLSKRGFAKLSAYIFIMILLVAGLNVSISWGVLLPQAVLMYTLGIVISGILISSQISFLTTIFIACFLIVLSYLQSHNLVPYEKNWYKHIYNLGDATIASITLALIALISWLSNREIDKALKRARISEEALRKQRDSLEKEVDRRTRELKQAQLEKISQLYHFAEFGRLASGLFHDLATPLNLVSLNLSKLTVQSKAIHSKQMSDIKIPLRRALIGTRKIENFIQAARKQIQYQKTIEIFSLVNEIHQTIQMLHYKTQEAHVNISFIYNTDIEMYGNTLKFGQLTTNLLLNAIDAYGNTRYTTTQFLVEIRLQKINNNIKLSVQDWGKGISKNHLKKIFEPFFTTKSFEKGIGLGLSISRDIVEKDFNGKIQVESNKRVGTLFTVEFPIKREPKSTRIKKS